MVFYEWHWGKPLLWKGLDGVGYFLDKTISSVTGRWVRLSYVKPTSVLTHSSLRPAVLYWILPWQVAKTASALHQIHSANWPGSRIRLFQGSLIYPNYINELRIGHALKHQLKNSEKHLIIACSVWGHNIEQLDHLPFPLSMAITSFLRDQRFQSSSVLPTDWLGLAEIPEPCIFICFQLTCWQLEHCLRSQKAIRGN